MARRVGTLFLRIGDMILLAAGRAMVFSAIAFGLTLHVLTRRKSGSKEAAPDGAEQERKDR